MVKYLIFMIFVSITTHGSESRNSLRSLKTSQYTEDMYVKAGDLATTDSGNKTRVGVVHMNKDNNGGS